MLITESMHLSNAPLVRENLGVVSKAYLYFAMAFSIAVELLKMQMNQQKQPSKISLKEKL
jgi:predicted tellurium resistance membrane protein TerC